MNQKKNLEVRNWTVKNSFLLQFNSGAKLNLNTVYWCLIVTKTLIPASSTSSLHRLSYFLHILYSWFSWEGGVVICMTFMFPWMAVITIQVATVDCDPYTGIHSLLKSSKLSKSSDSSTENKLKCNIATYIYLKQVFPKRLYFIT